MFILSKDTAIVFVKLPNSFDCNTEHVSFYVNYEEKWLTPSLPTAKYYFYFFQNQQGTALSNINIKLLKSKLT